MSTTHEHSTIEVDTADTEATEAAIASLYSTKLAAFARYAVRHGAHRIRIYNAGFDVLDKVYRSESVHATYHPESTFLRRTVSVGASTRVGAPNRSRLSHMRTDGFQAHDRKVANIRDLYIEADIAGISSDRRDPNIDRERYGHLAECTKG